MGLSDYSFHDSVILEVKEFTDYQTIEYLIDFPVDWEKNLFEHRILRFTDVIRYEIEEIPFGSQITILDVNELGTEKADIGTGRNEMIIERNKTELITNAGKRIITFSKCELLIA
ncbi:MAG: hypothetical protein ACHQHN_12290 [Sphingobacteriales bacterium]